MSYRDQYPLKRKYRKMSDDELLSVLLLVSEKSKEIGHPLELHPGERALANEYLLIGSKLDGYCARLKCKREEALEYINRLLEWPCPPL